ncbi:MAG: hypothetical protein ABH883_01500 [Candidatus Omnitrophota bacterium]
MGKTEKDILHEETKPGETGSVTVHCYTKDEITVLAEEYVKQVKAHLYTTRPLMKAVGR